MGGQRVGYTRVSSLDQNPDRQLDGVAVDRTFTDSASGRSTARPQLYGWGVGVDVADAARSACATEWVASTTLASKTRRGYPDHGSDRSTPGQMW